MKETNKSILRTYMVLSLVIIFIISLGLGYFNHLQVTENVRQSMVTRATEKAALAASFINSETVQSINSKADYTSGAYKELIDQIKGMQKNLKFSDTAVKIIRQKGSMTEIILDDLNSNHIGTSFDLWKEMTTAAQGAPAGLTVEINNINYAAGIAAIKDKRDTTKALLLFQEDYSGYLPSLLISMLYSGLAALAVFIILLIIVNTSLSKINRGIDSIYNNLRRLKEGKPVQKPDDNSPLSELFPSIKDVEKSMAGNKESEIEREKVQKQMTEFLKIVNAAADGDFTITAEVTAGTFGALADSFNLMISDLSELIRDVKKSTEQVSSSTTGILKTIAGMADGAEKQATQTVTISNFAKDLAELVKNTNLSAQRAAEAAQAAKDVAEQGSDMVKKSINVMHNIRQSVREASKQVRLLGENSTRIGEITDFISEIASRTNLLSLNASIEAARAGDAGRGFSVVADEIRNLAERSSNSAEEISKLIADIQTGISKTMGAMENGTQEVAEGTKSVDTAGEVLREIVGKVEISTKSSIEISNATKEQTRFSDEIVSSLEHIAVIAKETAEGAKKSTESATQMEALSQTLDQAVKKFRLG